MKRALVLAGAVLLVVACGGHEPGPVLDFAVKATTVGPAGEYGRIVPTRFTIRNRGNVTVLVRNLEATAGWRREIARLSERRTISVIPENGALRIVSEGGEPRLFLVHRGLLPPGRSIEVRCPYRPIVKEERLLFFVRPLSGKDMSRALRVQRPEGGGILRALRAGEVGNLCGKEIYALSSALPRRMEQEGAVIPVPCPDPPFEPDIDRVRPEAWTWSTALRGFVMRTSSAEYRLQTEEDPDVPLPPLPLDLLFDMDRQPDGLRLADEAGRVRKVGPEALRGFLSEILKRGRQIIPSEDPSRADYMVTER